jgi:hypothetical protein
MTRKMVAFAENALAQGQTAAINSAARTEFPGQVSSQNSMANQR